MAELVLRGAGYCLRRANESDAEFVLHLRAAETERTKYLNSVPQNVELQRRWISRASQSTDDFYFVIENTFSGKPEGLIGLYGVTESNAEWGRWILKPESTAAVESVYLIAKFAFKTLGLNSIFSRTLAENTQALKFHDSMGALRGASRFTSIVNDQTKELVEHSISREDFENFVQYKLLNKLMPLAFRNLRLRSGEIDFHHVGIAAKQIETEASIFAMLGYRFEGESFTDKLQGIRGLFMVSPGQPRIELLENLEGSHTLDHWLKNRAKAYHFAYKVSNLEDALDAFKKLGAKLIQPPKYSVYFGGNIAFVVLPNMFLVELIEYAGSDVGR